MASSPGISADQVPLMPKNQNTEEDAAAGSAICHKEYGSSMCPFSFFFPIHRSPKYPLGLPTNQEVLVRDSSLTPFGDLGSSSMRCELEPKLTKLNCLVVLIMSSANNWFEVCRSCWTCLNQPGNVEPILATVATWSVAHHVKGAEGCRRDSFNVNVVGYSIHEQFFLLVPLPKKQTRVFAELLHLQIGWPPSLGRRWYLARRKDLLLYRWSMLLLEMATRFKWFSASSFSARG